MQPHMAGGAIDAINLNAGLLSDLGVAVGDQDPVWQCVFASDQLETLSGYLAEELVRGGGKIDELIHSGPGVEIERRSRQRPRPSSRT